jgi:hypothetical protein
VEDWGTAFEGLPCDTTFYPAVSLYQPEDKVTLLSVESYYSPGGCTPASWWAEPWRLVCCEARDGVPEMLDNDGSDDDLW